MLACKSKCTKTQKLVLSCKNENKNKIRRTWYDEGGYILKIKIKRIHTKGARAGPHCWPPLPLLFPPFPCFAVSSSPFSTSSPKTDLAEDIWDHALKRILFQHCDRLMRTVLAYKQSDGVKTYEMQLSRELKSDNKENVNNEEKPQRHHSTKQPTDR